MLEAYLGRDKTIALVKERYYWLQLKKQAGNFVRRCQTCQVAKGHPKYGIIHASTNTKSIVGRCIYGFCIRSTENQREADSIMVIVDRFSKMAHFVACKKTSDVV